MFETLVTKMKIALAAEDGTHTDDLSWSTPAS